MHKTRIGQLVRIIETGRYAVVTDDVKLSGPNRGKLTAQLIGQPYQYGFTPDEVERVTLAQAADDRETFGALPTARELRIDPS